MGLILGMVFGATIAMFVLTWVIGRFAYRNLEPDKKAFADVATAWVVASALAGFGMANGEGFRWTASFYYFFAAMIVWAVRRRSLRKLWEAHHSHADVFE